MKKNKTKLAVKYEVFIPLINLLLFESVKTPKFKKDFENLSEEFVFANHFFKEVDPENEEYFRSNIYYFFNNLEIEKRPLITKIVTESEIFLSILMLKSIFKDKQNKSNHDEDFLFEINTFLFQGKISDSIYLFIYYQVEDIFGYNFSDTKIITKQQYEDLIVDLCNPKQPLYNH